MTRTPVRKRWGFRVKGGQIPGSNYRNRLIEPKRLTKRETLAILSYSYPG